MISLAQIGILRRKKEMRYLALFPGQGSQEVGMGRKLFEVSDVARNRFAQADAALGRLGETGCCLSELCFNGPAEALTNTAIAQPAILTVSVICFEIFKEQTGAAHEMVGAAGHSLGEYSANVACGSLDFIDAVKLVHLRGKYMQEAVPVGKGKMAAVLGVELAELEQKIAEICSDTQELVEIANINAPGQIVVAGLASSIDKLGAAFSPKVYRELQVSAPFHCRLMQPAADRLAEDLDALAIKAPLAPIVANFSALQVTNADSIRAALKAQVVGRVRWVECMERAVGELQPDLAIEFGAGKVLQGLLKRINPSIKRHGIDSLESISMLTI